ncbi:MAG: hypothetical protein WA580_08005 [Acidimicrobiales bacterium]|jgi:uncharacterized membrane protein
MASEIDDLRYRSATWRLRGRYALFLVLGLLIIVASKPPTPVRIALLVVASIVFIAAVIWIFKGLRLMRREFRLRREQRR